jgi:hypothetical protein
MNYYNCPIEYIDKSIGRNGSVINSFTENDQSSIITFKDFINEYKIPYIDFLKIDAEGAEYDIFTPENIGYLKRNVQFIAAEFHTYYPGNRDKLKMFRDNILPHFQDVRIRSCTTQNIVPGQSIDLSKYIKNDEFIDNYDQQITIYINNDKTSI